MVDTVSSLTSRAHDLMVASLSSPAAAGAAGQDAHLVAGFQDLIGRALVLGSDAGWLVAFGNSGLAGLAFKHRQVDQALYHLDVAVTAGYNDCLELHAPALVAYHGDPRFRALYQRMRITLADLDELQWLHREVVIMSQEASQASVDNIGRRDTGISLLPQAPLPTRVPNTPGILASRLEVAAVQTALRQAAWNAEVSRSSGNTSLSLIDDTWDYPGARRDAWDADVLDTRREQAAAARAFVERPGLSTLVVPCPPLGSLVYPA
ncbi:hypothetical protein ATKI12_7933 [Kitasatospora sp. Ki12]